jgi:capsid portal protein
MNETTTKTTPANIEAFTFGDPTPVLEHGDILESAECWLNGKWYEPPISFTGLAKSFNASVHHSSAIYFKANMLTSTFVPNKVLTRDAFKRVALDFLTFGNAYLALTEKHIFKVFLKIKLRESYERHWIPDKNARGRRI